VEEQQLTPEATEPEAEPTIEPAAPEAAAAAPAPDWRTALDTAPIDEVSKHPRFAGLLGERLQRERERIAQEAAETARRQADEEREADLLRLLEENDETLSTQYPKAKEALLERRRQREELDVQRRVGESYRDFSLRIGQAYASLPEWEEVVGKYRPALEEAINSKTTDAEQIQAFTITAADLVARVRADRQIQARIDDEVAKAKEAVRQEMAAERMGGTAAPDMRRPGGLPSASRRVAEMPEDEFDQWWQAHRAGT